MSLNMTGITLFDILDATMRAGFLSESSYDWLNQEFAFFDSEISELGLVREDAANKMISYENACIAVINAVREEYS